jgi:hypothetical protein
MLSANIAFSVSVSVSVTSAAFSKMASIAADASDNDNGKKAKRPIIVIGNVEKKKVKEILQDDGGPRANAAAFEEGDKYESKVYVTCFYPLPASLTLEGSAPFLGNLVRALGQKTRILGLATARDNGISVSPGFTPGGEFTKLKQSFKQRFETCVKKSRMK